MMSRHRPAPAGTSVAPVWANDFRRQWDEIRADALAAVERVGSSGWLILGDEVAAFEQELAAWWGVRHAVGVASGLDALEIALRCAAQRVRGEAGRTRVLTTPLTAFATTLAIIRAGLEPVWCDVDDSGGLDLDAADAMLERDRTIFALLPVHLYGHPLDLDALQRLAGAHDVVVVEDCAQSAGASWNGRPTGSAGLVAGTSLYPTKNLGALGDGGVVLTDDDESAEHARRLRDYGQRARYEHVELGLNSRLDELHAAVLRSALLPRLPGWLERRRAIAASYDDALREIDGPLRAIRPRGGRSAYHLYPVEVVAGDPARFAASFADQGIAVARHYPFVCPDQDAARELAGAADAEVPVARRLAANELSLPIHPHLSDDEVQRVISACTEASR
jgi:dTDP-3-amino-3,4,6-trideoxy-alpha-D-glucose transaminase